MTASAEAVVPLASWAQVLGLAGVVTEPSRLESTCLVFAHGVDLQVRFGKRP